MAEQEWGVPRPSGTGGGPAGAEGQHPQSRTGPRAALLCPVLTGGRKTRLNPAKHEHLGKKQNSGPFSPSQPGAGAQPRGQLAGAVGCGPAWALSIPPRSASGPRGTPGGGTSPTAERFHVQTSRYCSSEAVRTRRDGWDSQESWDALTRGWVRSEDRGSAHRGLRPSPWPSPSAVGSGAEIQHQPLSGKN